MQLIDLERQPVEGCLFCVSAFRTDPCPPPCRLNCPAIILRDLPPFYVPTVIRVGTSFGLVKASAYSFKVLYGALNSFWGDQTARQGSVLSRNRDRNAWTGKILCIARTSQFVLSFLPYTTGKQQLNEETPKIRHFHFINCSPRDNPGKQKASLQKEAFSFSADESLPES